MKDWRTTWTTGDFVRDLHDGSIAGDVINAEVVVDEERNLQFAHGRAGAVAIVSSCARSKTGHAAKAESQTVCIAPQQGRAATHSGYQTEEDQGYQSCRRNEPTMTKRAVSVPTLLWKRSVLIWARTASATKSRSRQISSKAPRRKDVSNY